MQHNPHWQAHKQSTAKMVHWIRLTLLDEKDEIMTKLSDLIAEVNATAAKIEGLVVAGDKHVMVDPATQTIVENSELELLATDLKALSDKVAAKMPAIMV